MGNTHRTVSVGATDDGFTSLIDQLKNVAGEMYDEIKQQAQEYTDDIDKQAKKINELLRKEKERTEIMREQNRLMLENRTQQKLDAIDNDPRLGSWMKDQKKKDVNEEHKTKMREIEEDARESRLVDRYARGKFQDDEDYQERGGEGKKPSRGKGGPDDGGFSRGVAQGMGFGAMLGMGSALSAIFGQGSKLQNNMLGLEAMTGISSFRNTENYGMSNADFADYVKNVAQTSGTSKNADEKSRRQLETERAFGLNTGSLNAINEHSRMGGISGGDMARLLINKAANSGLWNISKGDFSALGEKVEQTNAIMKKEGGLFDKYDGTKSADLLLKMGRLGGGFGDSRALDRINILDKGLKGGSNEFIQAQIFTALTSGDSANMDLFDVKMRQAQGILGKGNFSKVMGNLHSTWGKGTKNLKMNLLKMFPEFAGNEDAINTLANMGDQQIASFANLGGSNVKRFIEGVGTGDIEGRAGKFTGTVNQITAGVDNVAGKIGVASIEALGPTAKTMLKGVDGIATNILEGGAKIKEGAKEFAGAVKYLVSDDATRKKIDKKEEEEYNKRSAEEKKKKDAFEQYNPMSGESKQDFEMRKNMQKAAESLQKLVNHEDTKATSRNKTIPNNNPNGNKNGY